MRASTLSGTWGVGTVVVVVGSSASVAGGGGSGIPSLIFVQRKMDVLVFEDVDEKDEEGGDMICDCGCKGRRWGGTRDRSVWCSALSHWCVALKGVDKQRDGEQKAVAQKTQDAQVWCECLCGVTIHPFTL